MRFYSPSLLAIASLFCMVMLPHAPASALTFNIEYVGKGSANERPGSTEHLIEKDFGGHKLVAHITQAAADWSEIIEDGWTMNLNVYYAPQSIAGSFASFDPVNNFTTTSITGDKRVLTADIRVNDSADVYFDPEPQNDNEFGDYSRTMIYDLNPEDLEAGFDVDTNDLPQLEIGNIAPILDQSIEKRDLLSIMRHEVGHVVGLNQIDNVEFGDGDYDLEPALLGGSVVAVKINEGNTKGHFETDLPVMGDTGTVGGRRAITATDAFAAALGSGWNFINLARVDYVGPDANLNFASGLNWTGSRPIDPTDLVAIQNGASVAVNDDETLGELYVARSSMLSIDSGKTLFITKDAELGQSPGSAARMELAAGAELSAANIRVANDAVLVLEGATLKARLGDVINRNLLEGHGTINVAGTFSNNRTLRATQSVLTINGPLVASPLADLDGLNGNGTVDATSGSLQVDIPNSPTFGGTITIGAGQFVDLPNAWELEFTIPTPNAIPSQLNLQGSSSQAAELRGGDLLVRGQINVDKQAVLDVNVDVQGGSGISVPDPDDTLTFAKNASYNLPGFHTGQGKHVYEGFLQFDAGSLDIGNMEIANSAAAQITGGDVIAKTIQHDGEFFNLEGGTLAFEKFTGDLKNDGGTLIAGTQSTLNGDYEQSPRGALRIEIGGTAAGEFSSLNVSANANLAGALNVEITGGFTPATDQEFRVLTAGSVKQIDDLLLTGPNADQFKLVVNNDSIVLLALAQAILFGDADNDLAVSGSDLLAVTNNFGNTGPADGLLLGDADDNGSVSGSDLLAVTNNFGATLPGSLSSSSRSVTVPEPGSISLVFSWLLAITCLGRTARA